MSDHEGGGGSADDGMCRSRIYDFVEPAARIPPAVSEEPDFRVEPAVAAASALPVEPTVPAASALPVEPTVPVGPEGTAPPPTDDGAAARRREAAAQLGEFRRTAVLVPLSEDGDPLTGEYGGIRWIYAFSDEPSLARFAVARGDGARQWAYERVLGARLLDVAIPAMPVPYGVALDVGSDGQGALFPPVRGVVPDAAAVDARESDGAGSEGEFAR